MTIVRARFLRHAVLASAAAFALTASAVSAETVPTYGLRIYEVFQRGPKLDLEERTSRAFAPNHVRNLGIGVTWPGADQPALKVYKSRDHLGYFGSYWR